MKRFLLIVFLLHSLLIVAQDPIYNINKENLHLVNFAFYDNNNKFNISSENLFENYKNNNTVFNSVLDFRHDAYAGFNLGFNTTYENRNGLNNYKNFDFIISYKLYLFWILRARIAVNVGVLNNSYNNQNTYNRYTNDIHVNTYDFKKHNFNTGLSSAFYTKTFFFGMSANHLNKPKIPTTPTERIPIKYSAFIRKTFFDKKLTTNLVYQFQDGYLYDNIDMDYYYNMLNYMGVNIDYEFLMYSVGIGTKHLFNNSNINSIQAGLIFEKIKFYYSSSLFSNKNDHSLFHQFGIYFKVEYPPTYGKMSGRFL
jgi:hypothetical protein